MRTGYVPDEAVPALLRRAAVVAYPSLEEGYGLPALEALACGAPLVTTSGTAMAELAGEAAVLVPPGGHRRPGGRAGDLGPCRAAGGCRGGRAAPAGHGGRRRRTWEASAEPSHVEAYRLAAAGRVRGVPCGR